MLRKHYFNFNNNEVDYSRSYVEDDKGNIKNIYDAHNIGKSDQFSVTKPVFFDSMGGNVKMSEGQKYITQVEINKFNDIATEKILGNKDSLSKSLSDKTFIEKSDIQELNENELFSFVVKNSDLNYDESIIDLFNNISQNYQII